MKQWIGNPDMWADMFPGELVPDIIELILEAWSQVKLSKSDRLEVPLTRKLYCHLISLKRHALLPFSVWLESSEIDVVSMAEKGRIDIRFSHGYREDVYFAIECKRLNVCRGRRRVFLADEYVNEGMMRFVSGKYAAGLDKGGMLGYVMDGRLDDAISSVTMAIESRKQMLAMAANSTLKKSLTCPQNRRVHETNHKSSSCQILLHHMFVAVA